jgi:hypothetical protein
MFIVKLKDKCFILYSPVRHDIIIIRLACVKYIASVHSEPGSNSQKNNK